MDKNNLLKFRSLLDTKTEQFMLQDMEYEIIDHNLFIFMESSCDNTCIFCPKKEFQNRSYFSEIKDLPIVYENITDVHLAAEESFNVCDIFEIITYFAEKGLKVHIMSSLNGVDIGMLEKAIRIGCIHSITTSIHGYGSIHDTVTGRAGNFMDLHTRIDILLAAHIRIYSMGLILNQNVQSLSELSTWLLDKGIKHTYMYPRLKSIFFATKYMTSFLNVKKFLKDCPFPIVGLPLCILNEIGHPRGYSNTTSLLAEDQMSFLVEKYCSIYKYSYNSICNSCKKKTICKGFPIFTDSLLGNTREITPFL